MVKTTISQAPGSFTGGGVNPYESPSCTSVEISVNGPLCQSLTPDSGSIPGLEGEDWPTV